MKIHTRMPKNAFLRRFARLGAIALTLGLAAPIAHADWKVVDTDANKKLNDIKNKLGDMYNQQKIGGYVKLGDIVPDPDQKLVKQPISQDVQQCNSRPQAQQSICQEVVKTQNAQMAYMVTMFEYAKKRDQQLRDIQTERSKIGATELGKLEDNTNKLLALNTQLAIDQQQLQSVMYAYETRLKYLLEQQTRLAKSATSGTPSNQGNGGLFGSDSSLGQIMTTLTTGVALKASLAAVKSSKPDDMKRLHVGSSNGF